MADEFLMGAAFHDAALLHHDDVVGVAYGGEPMGDDDTGAALHEVVECLLN